MSKKEVYSEEIEDNILEGDVYCRSCKQRVDPLRVRWGESVCPLCGNKIYLGDMYNPDPMHDNSWYSNNHLFWEMVREERTRRKYNNPDPRYKTLDWLDPENQKFTKKKND